MTNLDEALANAASVLAIYDQGEPPRSISDQRNREYRLASALRTLAKEAEPDPEGDQADNRRLRVQLDAANRTIESFKTVFEAFDHLRYNGYAPPEYSPQWKDRALKAEAALAGEAQDA